MDIRIGIIGAGTISHCHIPAYQKLKGVTVAAVCDINLSRAEAVAEQYGIPAVYMDYHEMLQKENLWAVSICTWNHVHASISIDALHAGAHVLCEKPMAINTKEALMMEEAAEKKQRVLMPGFCTRYEEGVQLIKRQIERLSLGDIYQIKATYLRRHGNPGGWFSDKERSGGGPVIDLGVHVLDLARYLSGSDAVSVYAQVVKNTCRTTPTSRSPHKSADSAGLHDVEDFASAMLRLENGSHIFFETSWNHHLDTDRFQIELYGSKAGAVIYPRVCLFTDDAGQPCSIAYGHDNHEDRPNYDFEEEIAHFIRVTQGLDAPICTARDGTEVMRMVDSIYQSAEEQKEIIIHR